MLPRALVRACHPWTVVFPLASLGDSAEAPVYDRATLVRYRSRRDYLEIVLTKDWAQDVEHKRAAFEVAHSIAALPALTMLGPRTVILVFLLLAGIGFRVVRVRLDAYPSRPA